MLIFNDSVRHVLNSFGLIIFCSKTERYFILQRKHSPDIILLIRGLVEPGKFQNSVSKLTNDEKILLLSIKNGTLTFNEIFRTLMINEAFIGTARFAFFQNADYLFQVIEETEESQELEWNFPKGRLKKLESKLDAARREFQEEVGFPVPKFLKMSSHWFEIEDHQETVTLINQFRLCIVEEEFSAIPGHSYEVKDFKWVKDVTLPKPVRKWFKKNCTLDDGWRKAGRT